MSKKYQEIYQKLYQDIHSHALRNGEKLPSETQMMEQYNVSRQTIRKALAVLEEDGLIRKSQGRGSVVQFKEQGLHTKRVAVLFYDLDTSVFPIVMHRIDTVLYEHNYTASFYSTDGSINKERNILQQLIQSPVDGIIMYASVFSPICCNLDLIQKIQSLGTKILFFDNWYANPDLCRIPSISIDNYSAPYQITKYLIDKGHTRIGGAYLSSALGHCSRYAGICNALMQCAGYFDPKAFLGVDREDTAEIIHDPKVKELFSGIDAFVCTSGVLTPIMIEALRLYGKGNLRTVVFFDEEQIPSIEGVDYIFLRHSSAEVGMLCAEGILSLINGEEISSVQVPWQLSELSTITDLPGFN